MSAIDQPMYVRSVPDKCPGLYRPFVSPDGSIVRVRSGGQFLTCAELLAFTAISSRHSDGWMQITTRGAMQIRGLVEALLPTVTAEVEATGLVPKPSHELCRNIVVSPLTGLDGNGCANLSAMAAELDAAICAEESLAALPGRFLFALDDGRGDVARVRFDLAYQAIDETSGLVAAAQGTQVWRVPRTEAVAAIISLAKQFVAARESMPERAWHIRELNSSLSLAYPTAELADFHRNGADPAFGPVVGADGGVVAFVAGVPLGLISDEQLQAASRQGADRILVTCFRSIVIPSATVDAVALDAVGLITDADSSWAFTAACTGTPGCERADSDARRIARELVVAFDSGKLQRDGLPVYVSACNRRCGAPNGRYHDIFDPESLIDAVVQLAS